MMRPEGEWLQVVIEPAGSLQRGEMRTQIYGAIRKLIRDLEASGFLQSFHFFHEYGNVELRIQYIEDAKNKLRSTRDKVEEFTDYALKGCMAASKFTVSDDYDGELDRYGRDGWPVVKLFFEACSRVVLTEWDGEANLGTWFKYEKLLHCFNNQHFASILMELTLLSQMIEHYSEGGIEPLKIQVYDDSWGEHGEKGSLA